MGWSLKPCWLGRRWKLFWKDLKGYYFFYLLLFLFSNGVGIGEKQVSIKDKGLEGIILEIDVVIGTL